MIANVELTTTRPGRFKIVVNGVDMSDVVNCVTIEAVADELTTVSLQMHARVTVQVSGPTYVLSPIQVSP